MSSAEPDGQPVERPPRSRLVVGFGAIGLAIVVVAVAAGLLSSAASPRPSASLIAGRIVVVDGQGGVRTIDATGAAERRFDVTAALAQYPAWSPDGSRLAIISLDDDGAGVFVVDDAATPAVADPPPAAIYQSLDTPPFYLFWSPDGRQVTFLTTESDGLALRTVPADGSADGGIVRRGAPMYWDWTADDRMLVHAGGDGPEGYVGELRLDGSEAAPTAVMPGSFQAPAVSDDGRRRAFVVADGSGQAIVAEDADGSTRQVEVTGATALDWSPSAAAGLAFVTLPGSPEVPIGPIGPLDILDAGASAPRRLLDETVLAFFWSPDGASIAVLALETDAPRPVASRLPLRPRAAGDPSGVRSVVSLEVLDVADGSITLELPVRLSSPFINQVLPFYDQYARSHSLWSPDSRAIVLPLVGEDDLAHIVVVPADGRPPSIVADGEVAFWAPAPKGRAP